MQSAAALPEAREVVERFRSSTLAEISLRLTGRRKPRAALRNALLGWLSYVDAAILDWVSQGDLRREQLRDMILAAFASALLAAQRADPKIQLA